MRISLKYIIIVIWTLILLGCAQKMVDIQTLQEYNQYQDMPCATFGAGCFWGVQSVFEKTEGVIATFVGYSGGNKANPSYFDVCNKNTGHAEVVRVVYDSTKISYQKLLEFFWEIHDPTSLNRQGPDVGEQYRSVIFYHDSEQLEAARSSQKALESAKKYQKPIVTQILPAETFYLAEEYHQHYNQKQGKPGGTWR
jgi:peptide-methionine (S)-S-oxide reductase